MNKELQNFLDEITKTIDELEMSTRKLSDACEELCEITGVSYGPNDKS